MLSRLDPRVVRLATMIVGGLLGLWLIAFTIDTLARRGETVRNVQVAGTDVGGLGDDDLVTAIDEIANRLDQRTVEVTTGGRTFEFTAGEVGLVLDRDAMVESARDAGRGFLLFRPVTWLADLVSSHKPRTRYVLDENRLSDAMEAAGILSADAAEPAMTLESGVLVAVAGRAGITVEPAALRNALIEHAGDDPIAVAIDGVAFEPAVATEAVEEIVERANTITQRGIDVVVGDEQPRHLEPDTLRSWLQLDTTDGAVELDIDDDAATEALGQLFPDFSTEGRPARFEVPFGAPVIVEGEPTTSCCAPGSGDAILTAVSAGRTEATLVLAEVPHPRGREWAEGLGVNELVGEYTTRFPPGQPRVRNIERIAELTRGLVLEAGQTFSVNDTVGRRTEEKGFVSAPVIYNGEFREDIGGGISQYATTLFNAAFFAGLEFDEYQSHSIYIDRYPYGREATLSYPKPDLQIVNPTPYAVLIWPTTTADSITVRLYSTRWATAEQTGQSERVQGTVCTRVTTERTRTFTDGRTEVDDVFAVYRPSEGVDCAGRPTTPTTTLPPPTTTEPTPTTTVVVTTTAPPVTTTLPPPPTTTTTTTTLPPPPTTTTTTTTLPPPPTTTTTTP